MQVYILLAVKKYLRILFSKDSVPPRKFEIKERKMHQAPVRNFFVKGKMSLKAANYNGQLRQRK